MAARGWIFGLLLVVAGCAETTVRWLPTNAPPRPLQKKWPAYVEVFSASKPSRPFVEVGFIEAGGDDEMPRTVTLMRERAAEVGCDGLVMMGVTETGGGDVIKGIKTTTYRGTCIVYR